MNFHLIILDKLLSEDFFYRCVTVSKLIISLEIVPKLNITKYKSFYQLLDIYQQIKPLLKLNQLKWPIENYLLWDMS